MLCLAALAYPAGIRAQVPSPSADREARDHFERGREAFSRGDYPNAASQFEQAYALSHRSALLYNIGTAYERLHRWAEARLAFQRYVNENPMASDRPEVEARLRMLAVELNRQLPPALVTDPRTATGSAGTAPLTAPTPGTVAPQPPVTDLPRPWRTVFWTTGLVAVGAGAVTLTLGVVSNQRYNSLASTCAPNCLAIDVDDMRQRQLFINVGIAATSVLAAAAATAFVLDYLQVRRSVLTVPQVAWVPVPGGAVMAIGGTL